MGIVSLPIMSYAYYSKDISDKERLVNRNNTGIVLLDKNDQVIYSLGSVGADRDVTLAEISDDVERAVIASEDEEFYTHGGYSIRGMARAMYANILNSDSTRYGGSTITQQLVKNTLTGADKTYFRKYQEVSMAIAVERRYSKEEILEMYLNSVYFGEGAFGIHAAAKTYFNKSPADLTLAESSMLIGILPAPTINSPISGDKEQAEKHQARVLRRMVETGGATEEKAKAAEAETIALNEQTSNTQKHAHHFTVMVLEELKEKYGEEEVVRRGFKVKTSLDLGWQQKAEAHVRERVEELKSSGGTNASLVAIDPKTGEIRALVGSANWEDPTSGKVNIALTNRQPGSSFKPIYYAEAMERKVITPATILKDQPTTYDTYKPTNFDFKNEGNITTRRSLGQSKNITSVEIMQKMGVAEAAEGARRMGISTITEPDKYGLTLAVGTAEVKLLELTNAYAALANAGSQFSPVTIVSIKDKYDKEVFTNAAVAKKVISPQAAYLTSSILSDTKAHAPTFSSLDIAGRQVAVKTGTTDKNHDAWTMGYTPSVAVGVWVGNNENTAMSGVAGASGAGPIWKRSMMAFLENTPTEQFNQPDNIVKLRICQSNGQKATYNANGTYEEFFIKGTEPTGSCTAEAPKAESKKEEKKEEDEQPEERREGGRGAGDIPTEEPPTEEPPVEDPPAEEPTDPPPTQPTTP